MPISLQFPLDIEEGWPPVGSESLAFDKQRNGYKLLVPPLFVRNISVSDVIDVTVDSLGYVSDWEHVELSNRSVVWLLRTSDHNNIGVILSQFRKIGCNTTGIDEFGAYSVDVPENASLAQVDNILSNASTDEVAIAFPSFRHSD